MKISKKVICLVVISFLLGSFISFIAILSIIKPTLRVIETWEQPVDIVYSNQGPYYLSIVEDSLDISRIPYSIKKNYLIYIGRDKGTPVHGHVVNFSFTPSSNNLYDIEKHIKESKVIWNDEGIIFEESTGTKLFIPAQYLGGR